MQCLRTRPVAGGNTPAKWSIALEILWIVDGVLALRIRGAPAVFEIITALSAHERLLNAAKIEPAVRQLMGKQRAGVNIVVTVVRIPAIGLGPGNVAVIGKRVRGRPQRQHIQQQGFVVAFPAILYESGFGPPAVGQGCAAVLSPGPTRPEARREGQEWVSTC